ncbi:ABC transporter ATP-binding protein [Maliponia aquimaris]|uniref:sn-glycerol-3-phosphate import ATP-binding protein UgpC n=1 Tax=Maliponia aquimaris TaxID=1673631 RepID=A0A238L2B2_9RHOB|nr:sn-glycerol-3-phosphate ABC transporter ATP-binding protein UgpC [Maliponia aquimaris]SMX48572.1 sn-glycerol-3-phosphate import ATP-binding protein UgpC [Maliponia aquimaris]
MATLSLDNVKKSFGKTEVIHDVNIDITDGEFIVIVGPSGCGKSTLLRMVAGLETVSAGEIRIEGKRVNEVEPMDRDIAMVFQNYALYPHMSVFDNMAYGLKIAGTPKPEIESRVATAAKMLQLEPYLKRRPRELSGGQRQRVAMGRAIVRKPAVFLFDEPLSNLDAKLRVQMRLEIKALQRELGVTALYVTHDQVEAMTLADRMIVMNAGVADQIGAPLEVYSNPRTTFVAGFIGSPPTNFLKSALLGENAGAALVGIRPEHLSLAATGRLTARVVYAEALGAETLVHLRTQDGTQITVRQDAADPIPHEGAESALAWDPAVEMRFDKAGKRL